MLPIHFANLKIIIKMIVFFPFYETLIFRIIKQLYTKLNYQVYFFYFPFC
jgi:hypothetical protein